MDLPTVIMHLANWADEKGEPMGKEKAEAMRELELYNALLALGPSAPDVEVEAIALRALQERLAGLAAKAP